MISFDQTQKMLSGLGSKIEKSATSIVDGVKDLFSRKEKTYSVPFGTVKEEARFKVVGFCPDNSKAPAEYYVRIISYRLRSIIVGLIQSSISLSVDSTWEFFVPTAYTEFGWLDDIVQIVSRGKTSLVNRPTQRRKWKGTSPVGISLSLRFEAVNDAYTDVVLPGKLLQELALPSEGAASELSGIKDIWSAIPFLSPPGPSPFTAEDILNVNKDAVMQLRREAILSGKRGGDLISICFGNFLMFENVIVKKVVTEYDPRFDPNGNPIGSNVLIMFDTYEIMTVETLDRAYSLRPIEKQGGYVLGKRVFE